MQDKTAPQSSCLTINVTPSDAADGVNEGYLYLMMCDFMINISIEKLASLIHRISCAGGLACSVRQVCRVSRSWSCECMLMFVCSLLSTLWHSNIYLPSHFRGLLSNSAGLHFSNVMVRRCNIQVAIFRYRYTPANSCYPDPALTRLQGFQIADGIGERNPTVHGETEDTITV